MTDKATIREQQTSHWDGEGGKAWVEAQSIMDAMFSRLADRLAERAAQSGADTILDIGCGTGATTLTTARAAPDAQLKGVDISGPMLGLARQRASEAGIDADFIKADAETHEFKPAAFDRLISRFGVMFFADPSAAFANLRTACRPGASLDIYAWRSPKDNAFMTTGTRAAAPYLDDMPKRELNAPGQFGFEDADYVQDILKASGWQDIQLEPEDIECRFPKSAIDLFLTRLGPLPKLLENKPEAERTEIMQAVRAAYTPYIKNGEIRYTAGCWSIRAAA